MSLAQSLAAGFDGHIRLSILRLLDEAPSYTANDSVLHQLVNSMGLSCTRDQMRSHLTWLEEQRLLTVMMLDNGLRVASVNERGTDVAHGRSIIPGVQRPSARG